MLIIPRIDTGHRHRHVGAVGVAAAARTTRNHHNEKNNKAKQTGHVKLL